jgi:hypothetical protein
VRVTVQGASQTLVVVSCHTVGLQSAACVLGHQPIWRRAPALPRPAPGSSPPGYMGSGSFRSAAASSAKVSGHTMSPIATSCIRCTTMSAMICYTRDERACEPRQGTADYAGVLHRGQTTPPLPVRAALHVGPPPRAPCLVAGVVGMDVVALEVRVKVVARGLAEAVYRVPAGGGRQGRAGPPLRQPRAPACAAQPRPCCTCRPHAAFSPGSSCAPARPRPWGRPAPAPRRGEMRGRCGGAKGAPRLKERDARS